MKFLLDILKAVRPSFEAGGRLRAFKPVFDAMENFFFAPAAVTLAAPHVRDPLDIKRLMSMVIIAVLPSLFTAFYFFGWRLVPMIIVSYAAGGAVEVAFAVIRKDQINTSADLAAVDGWSGCGVRGICRQGIIRGDGAQYF